ncbi:SPT2 chromatin protein-domain-containing protein [Halteromyces radiatus]|uniref:SPT2 chromatin protein-domain-containing protein n=1 Tax=Halteromyces radiatus TaxID=101107 RepID=UPI00222106A1|nr:SPT2 chromatin protein-domain-containing protein [Halteromyces radiatus]KAI8081490.1 SPT2 chromatin protein-domain-containing protein [Halteromyces radiatus]
MLKGKSKDITFEQLMQQAAEVAKAQDAVLEEKAKERRRLEDERRQKDERALLERQKKERMLKAKEEEIERRQRMLVQQKQQSSPLRKPITSSTQQHRQRSIDSKSQPSSKSTKSKNNSVSSLPLVEKKKPVHMSYEQLLEKAKEVSIPKKSTSLPPSSSSISSKNDEKASVIKSTANPTKDNKPSYSTNHRLPKDGTKLATNPKKDSKPSSSTNHHRLPKELYETPTNIATASASSTSLYVKRSAMAKSKSQQQESMTTPSNIPARDRLRLLYNTPAQKVVRAKRDRQSIEEIQRDIRHSKGKYSDDDSDNDRSRPRKRQETQLSSSRHSSSAYMSRKPQSPPSTNHRQPIRMPFRRPMDPERFARRHRPRDDYIDEDDDDLEEFIVDDDEEDDYRTSDYSSEIGKIFRYDRNRYINESVYSDDDMEANPMDVIREEKQSERLARREDQLEEQREIERRKKRLGKSKWK